MVEQGNYAAKLLQSLEENRRADYFCYDISCGSNFPADPIYNKQQLINAAIYGYAE